MQKDRSEDRKGTREMTIKKKAEPRNGSVSFMRWSKT